MSPSRSPGTISSSSCALELTGAPALAGLLGATAVLLPPALLIQAREGAWLATVLAIACAFGAWPAWRALLPRPGWAAPRRLWWDDEAVFQLERRDGARQPVRIADRSLVHGPWLVLVLEGARRRELLVIETWRAPPVALASLRRSLARLGATPADSRHALRSLLHQGGPAP